MSSEPSSQGKHSVTEGPVTVTKSFEADEFPVPAIKFVVESDASESVNIRVIDSIPESFPMENVGFHPDFEKDNWTAYKSHRVEYDRTLAPGESTTTVYGIRLDDTDTGPEAFSTPPTLSILDAEDLDIPDDAIDDVLGEDSNQLVRDVLSGERDTLPGLDESSGNSGVDAPDLTAGSSGGGDRHPEDITLELDDPDDSDSGEDDSDSGEDDTDDGDAYDADTPQPAVFDDSGDAATGRATIPVATAVEGVDDTDTNADADAAAPTDADDTASDPSEDLELELELDDADEPADDGDATGEDGAGDDAADEGHRDGPRVTAGSVVGALAAELQQADADSDDVAALRDALGVEAGTAEIPRSAELRIDQLQSQVQDLAAYTGALEEFLDEDGTAAELIEGFRADVHALEDDVDEISAGLADADADRGRLRDDVTDVRSDLSAVDDRLDTVDERIDETTDRLDAMDERFDETTGRLDAMDERIDETTGRLDAMDERFAALDDRLDDVAAQAEHADTTAERLDEEMGEVREELATLDGDIAEAREVVEAETAPIREDVDDLRTDVADLDGTVEEFRAFRNRLSDALGPMVGGPAAEPNEDGDEDDGDGAADADDGGADDGEDGDEDDT